MADSEYPIVRRPKAHDLEQELRRECHALVVQEHGRWGGVPEGRLAQWHYDLRKGKLRIYGAFLRWVDEMIEHGSPLTRVLGVLPLFERYIRTKHEERQRQRGVLRERESSYTAHAFITGEMEAVR